MQTHDRLEEHSKEHTSLAMAQQSQHGIVFHNHAQMLLMDI